MVIFLVIVFLGCSADAKESKMCDRVQFSFDDLNGINNNQNFTRQTFEKNGQPVYYSFRSAKYHQNIQTLIWWDNRNNTWLSQTINNFFTSTGNKITKTKIKISNQKRLSFFFQWQISKSAMIQKGFLVSNAILKYDSPIELCHMLFFGLSYIITTVRD